MALTGRVILSPLPTLTLCLTNPNYPVTYAAAGGGWCRVAAGDRRRFSLLAELVLTGEKSSNLGTPLSPEAFTPPACRMHLVRRPSPPEGSAPRRRCRSSTDTRWRQLQLQLQLRVVSSKNLWLGHVVVHNPGLGETVAGVSVGQTTWHLVTPVERVFGSDRLLARCPTGFSAEGSHSAVSAMYGGSLAAEGGKPRWSGCCRTMPSATCLAPADKAELDSLRVCHHSNCPFFKGVLIQDRLTELLHECN